jgi:predicted thioesterase
MSGASELKPGLIGRAELVVGAEHLASAVGSGLVDVFSTPMLIALLENAAVDAVTPTLGAGQTSVGVHLDVKHLAATPRGMRVRAHAELTEVNGRMLSFKVWAEDERERIGEGTHQRALIDRERFERKAAEKAGVERGPLAD